MSDITIAQGELDKLYEDALLGFIITDPDKLLEVAEILPSSDYFSDPSNKAAYDVFLKLFREDRFPGSPVLMIPELLNGTQKKYFESEDAAARYVNALIDAPTVHAQKFNPKAFVEYAEYIKWQKDKRDLQAVGAELIGGIDKVVVGDREEFVNGIEDRFANITMNIHGKDSLMHISEITSSFEERLAKLQNGEVIAGGISVGIDNLDKTLNGLQNGELVVLAARPALGKSLLARTEIFFLKKENKGEIIRGQLKDVRVGDYVYNRHGKPVEVLGVFPQGELDAYELTFSDGRKNICSADHIWPYYQHTRRNNIQCDVLNNITLQEMLDRGIHEIKPHEKDDPTRRNRARFSMPINEAVAFPEHQHELKPYLMGVFLGDGCRNDSGDLLLSSEFETHVKKIANLLGAVEYGKQKTGYTWRFYISNNSNKKCRLKVADIDPKYEELLSNTYCGDKYIPKEYLFDSIENRWELLRGLMDTDGTMPKERPWSQGPSFSTTSKKLADDVIFLCRSLGMIATLHVGDRRGQVHKTHGKEYIRQSVEYTVSILCSNENKAKMFTIPHKLERAQKAVQHGLVRGKHFDRIRLTDVKKLPEKQEMICLSVDDDEELFLCNDFLVTHNTTLSMQIAYNVAQTFTDDQRNAVLVFSLEMTEDQLTSRMIATAGRINMKNFVDEFKHLNEGYYAETYSKSFEDKVRQKLDAQMARSRIALEHVKGLPIYTTTEPGLTPNSIKSLAMQKKREIERNGDHLALIVIDYLQLITPSLSKSNASRTEEVGDMSRKMKLLAKEFDIPVLLLAQLNRNASVNERPDVKDLRESGSIEQDADKIMFIWSENKGLHTEDFREYTDDAAKVEALRREQMKVTVTVGKNRQGETGDCPMIFDQGFQTFVSQSDEYAASNEQYEEFAEKYYQKTRTNDLFWPLREGEIPEALERFRVPLVREVPYLTPEGQLLTLANDTDNNASASMGVKTTTNYAAQGFEPAAQTNAERERDERMEKERQAAKEQLDRAMPAAMPVVEDLSTGFEEISADSIPVIEPEPEPVTIAQSDSVEQDDPAVAFETIDDDEDIVLDIDDDDDDLIDLDELDMLEQLSEELSS